MDKATEVLTPRGWLAFPEVQANDQVLEYDPNTHTLRFVTPTRFVSYPYRGELLHFLSQQLNLMVTPDHRMLLKTRRDEFITLLARDWKQDYLLLNAATFVGGNSALTPAQVRLAVAI